MSRLLGVDHGTKRIGLALSDAERRMASPLETLDAGRDVARVVQRIVQIAREWGVAELVVGLPLNMDGSEGPQARAARAFGQALAAAGGLPVQYWDERLTSRAAEEALREADLTRGKAKARVDRVAAALMLQACLDAQAGPAGETPSP